MTIKSTLEENLNYFTEEYKKIYGDDFVIKPQGVISNIATAQSLVKMDFEDELLILKQQLNPMTATGQAQDSLYSNIKLIRRQATYTKITRTIQGTAGTVITAGSLLIEDNITNEQFKINADTTIGENGKTTGFFTCENLGAVNVDNTATFTIKTPLAGVQSVYYENGNDINVGVDYEDDETFRKRWLDFVQSQSKMKQVLLSLVDNAGDILIKQNRNTQTYPEFPTHTMAITINSAESDIVIAKKIFDNLVDGVGLYGSTTVNIVDDSNQTVEVKFTRSTSQDIYIKAIIVKTDSATQVEAITESKLAIQTYYSNEIWTMGSLVIANRFINSIDEASSVDYVVSCQVSVDGVNYKDTIQLTENTVPVFMKSKITIEVQ